MSSKIKVDTIENVAGSGNVSLGSGHNLVVPGNNSTTGNATVGGTLGVTGAATIGGLTTLNGKFLIDGSNNDLMTFRTTGDTASQVLGLQFQNNSEAVTAQIFGTGDNSSNGVFRIKGIGNVDIIGGDVGVTGAAADLRVHTGGQVTMPNTPFVRLQLTSHVSPNTSVSSPGNQITGFTVRENVGSYWNSSNNNFTCPVAGVYSASLFYIKYPVSGHAHVDLHKNGVKVNEIRWRAPEVSAGYHQVGGTASVTCAANDVLDWHYFGSAGIHDGNGSWEIMLSH